MKTTAEIADGLFELVVVGDESYSILGYWYEDVARHYGPEFRRWMRGQTCTNKDNKVVVYSWDLYRYMEQHS